MTVERAMPPLAASEREMLEAWLELHRATLAVKCGGLIDSHADLIRQRIDGTVGV